MIRLPDTPAALAFCEAVMAEAQRQAKEKAEARNAPAVATSSSR